MLKPWKHYVPLSSDKPDKIEDVIRYFKEHQDVSVSIAERGFEAIKNHLRMKDVFCYWRKLLKSYAKLIKFDVERDPSLHEIRRKPEHAPSAKKGRRAPDHGEL